MARLSNKTITTVFDLQRKLLEILDKSTKTEFSIFEEFGETEETLPELEELQNIKERADSIYSRFYTTLRRIYLSQPVASHANLELLTQTILESEAAIEALKANIQEIKRNWDLL